MNEFIIADPKKCIGCRTCEVACVMAHLEQDGQTEMTKENFRPRIHVVMSETVSTAILCRQCEDAPCSNVCPNGAISHRDNFIYVSQDKCIGCKTCVVACPYGTMEVITRPVMRQNGSSSSAMTIKAEANKCDMCCNHAEGPACIHVCPTDALVRVNQEYIAEVVRQKRRRAALDNTADLLFNN